MPLTKLTFKTQQEWLEQRQKGIGGSDVAALFEKSKWMTRTDLIKSKVVEQEAKDPSPVQKMGHLMEPVIIKEYVIPKYSNVMVSDNEVYINPKFPVLQASPDAIAEVDGVETIVEIKFSNNAGTTNWKTEEGDWALPEEYWMQVQHYMAVFELKNAKVVAYLQDIGDVIEFDVPVDTDFIYQLKVKAVQLMEETKSYTEELQTSVEPIDAAVVIKDLGEILGINKQIKKLTTKKTGVQARLLSTYETGTKMVYNNIKGTIYERKTKSGVTRVLKVS